MRLDLRVGPTPSEIPISELSLSLRAGLRALVFLGLKGRSVRPWRPLMAERLLPIRGGVDAMPERLSSLVRSETSSPSATSPSHSSSESDSTERARRLESLFSFVRCFVDILMKILGRESGWTFEAEGSKAESEPIFLLYSDMQRWNGSVKSASEAEQ
jgi:hypothetical protein